MNTLSLRRVWLTYRWEIRAAAAWVAFAAAAWWALSYWEALVRA